jgi:Spy/CpxP family protein refolding chaperone
MIPWRVVLIMLFVTALGGGLAGWAGVEYGLHRAAAQDNLDTVLHRDLNLSPAQTKRIEEFEASFARDRVGYETQMREANKTLAHALTSANENDPEMKDAIQRFHTAMAALQLRTVQHVLSMRSVLTPDQKVIFDRTVNRSLGASTP